MTDHRNTKRGRRSRCGVDGTSLEERGVVGTIFVTGGGVDCTSLTVGGVVGTSLSCGGGKTKKDMLERALAIKVTHYGKDHYEASFTLTILANAIGALGDPRTKKVMLLRALWMWLLTVLAVLLRTRSFLRAGFRTSDLPSLVLLVMCW